MRHASNVARLLCAAVAVTVGFVLAVPMAQAKTPAPGYEKFAGCPSPEEFPGIEACFVSTITGGHFQMGNKDVPISKPIKLSGGGTPSGFIVANSKGGLEKVKQPVPGGIIGLTGLDWLVDFLSLDGLKLYATTELVGQPGNPFNLEPFALPIRVHLENPVLGNNCFIGSPASPIALNLTPGKTSPPPPNKSIKGQFPVISDGALPGTLLFDNAIFVDNSFAAPKTNGCELNLGLIHIGIDTLVSSVSGLPAPAGTNETIQNVDTEVAFEEFVYP
jgi:hypothetical protein